jgi:hypothetical protein
MNKIKEALLEAYIEINLGVNSEKTKCIMMSHHQNSEQKSSNTIANGPFENVAKLKYLGMTLISQNLTQEEIRSRLNFIILSFVMFICEINWNSKIKEVEMGKPM